MSSLHAEAPDGQGRRPAGWWDIMGQRRAD
jgi:hypothetical protein